MKRGGFDKDEVLTPLIGPFLLWHKREYSSTLTEEEVSMYDFHPLLGISREEFIRRFHLFFQTDEFRALAPFQDAEYAIPKLTKRNQELYVITARPLHLQNNSRAWFDAYFPNHIIDIHHVGTEDSARMKAELARALKLDYFVDDSPLNALAIAEAGVPVFVPRKPWNGGLDHPLITYYDTWRELLSRL